MAAGAFIEQVFDTIVFFKDSGRDATLRRLTRYFLRGIEEARSSLPKATEKDHEKAREEQHYQMRFMVEMALQELKTQRRIRQSMDAWVPLKHPV